MYSELLTCEYMFRCIEKILFSNAWCCLVCYLHDKIKNICLLFIYTNAPETGQIQTDV